jgi:hypothetical protein
MLFTQEQITLRFHRLMKDGNTLNGSNDRNSFEMLQRQNILGFPTNTNQRMPQMRKQEPGYLM